MKNMKIWIFIWDVGKYGFAAIGAIWTAIEILGWYFPAWEPVIFCQSHISVMIAPAAAAAVGRCLYLRFLQKRIIFSVKGVKVEVKAGNILHKQKGVRVVGINRQLNTKREQIGETSIHRAVLDLYGQERLNQAFRKGRKQVEEGRLFFLEKLGKKEYLFLCMSDLNGNSAASTTKEMIRKAMDDLFYHQELLRVPKGRMYFPVLGTGEGGFCLNKQDTVKFMIERIWDFQRQVHDGSTVKIKEICIVIYRKDVDEINWGELKQWAGQMEAYCMECPRFEI